NGVTHPNRYDVVVFKYPNGPVERNTPKNYIKRLMGLPGELLAIFFGRIYRWNPNGAPPPFDDGPAVNVAQHVLVQAVVGRIGAHLNQKDEQGNKIAVDPNNLWHKDHM